MPPESRHPPRTASVAPTTEAVRRPRPFSMRGVIRARVRSPAGHCTKEEPSEVTREVPNRAVAHEELTWISECGHSACPENAATNATSIDSTGIGADCPPPMVDIPLSPS